MTDSLLPLAVSSLIAAGSALLGSYLTNRHNLRQAELLRQSEERRHHEELVFKAALDNWTQSRELGKHMAAQTNKHVRLMPLDVFLVHMASLSRVIFDPTVNADNLKERLEEAHRMMKIAESTATRLPLDSKTRE